MHLEFVGYCRETDTADRAVILNDKDGGFPMMKKIAGNVTAPKGFQAAGIYCGIRKNKSKKDLALIYSEQLCSAAGVYTTNLVKGAPILVTKAHIADGTCKAIICNSGNANTCNRDGVAIAEAMCESLAARLGIAPSDVAVASTGVIGQPLPLDSIQAGIPTLCDALSAEGGMDAANAILTTDLKEKEIAVEFELGGVPCRVGGIAKGSGMIKPNMATMLAFVTSDVKIAPALLQKAVSSAAGESFNCISVDGDTSTNDTLLVLANGAAGAPEVTETEGYDVFYKALLSVCTHLAKCMAKDGEGATKLVICEVKNGPDTASCIKLAKSVIESNLVKAAMFGADANWGRVLCALGYAGVQVDVEKIGVEFVSQAGSVLVCENGYGVDFSEEEAKKVLSTDEVTIAVDLRAGAASGTAYGCDLTYDYVKINGDYRT